MWVVEVLPAAVPTWANFLGGRYRRGPEEGFTLGLGRREACGVEQGSIERVRDAGYSEVLGAQDGRLMRLATEGQGCHRWELHVYGRCSGVRKILQNGILEVPGVGGWQGGLACMKLWTPLPTEVAAVSE
jgi:hypothetical protein